MSKNDSKENDDNNNNNDNNKKQDKQDKQTGIYADYEPMSPLEIPLWSKIRQAKNVLITGCGGGYDCYQGIPLYYAIKTLKNIKNVYIGNYSFTNQIFGYEFKTYKDSKNKIDLFAEINYKKKPKIKTYYFPEYFLSQYFYEKEKQDITIYTFPPLGVKYLNEGYEILVKMLEIDCIICVDGGTDSLMIGNEFECGTIREDYTSMFSLNLIKNKIVKHKIHCVLGLGVDRFHGTSDVSSWRAIAELKKNGSFLGGITLMEEMKGVKKYREASDFATKFMQQSIVGSSILDGIKGHFGNYHSNERTKGSKLFINPSMSIYFTFDLDKCCKRIHKYYLKEMKNTESANDAGMAIHKVRAMLKKENVVAKAHENFPETDELE